MRHNAYLIRWLYWLIAGGAALAGGAARAQAPQFSQAFVFAKGGPNEGAAIGTATALDAAGNVYLTGHFLGRQRFGTGTYLTAQGPSPALNDDVFVAKLAADGTLLWVVQGGGDSDDTSIGIALDAVDNIYITGKYLGLAATFGATTIRNTGAGVTGDLFVAKLSPDGQWLWAVSGGGSDKAEAAAIAVSAAGTSYITGRLGVAATGSGTTLGPFNVPNVGGHEIFVAQLDANGVWQWVRTAAGSEYDFGAGIALDAQGSAYVTGNFASPTIAFGPVTLSRSPILPGVPGIPTDLFVAKINAAGMWQWAVASKGTDAASATAIALDAQGNSYVTGVFRGQATFGTTPLASAGNMDVVVASLTPAGAWRWAVAAGGATEEYATSIAVDSAGNSHVTGQFGHALGDAATFGPATLRSVGQADIFVARCSAAGQYQWAIGCGGTGDDICRSVSLFRNRKLCLTGGFYSPTARFTPLVLPANPNTSQSLLTGWLAWLTDLETNKNPSSALKIPNIITPNGDGLNDTFVPQGLPAGPWALAVYNRWGTLIHEAAEYKNEWGPAASSGLYYYLLRNASTGQLYKGWVEVVD